MTRLQKTSVFTLVVGLMCAVLVVPWTLSTIQQTTDLLKQQQEMRETEVVPVPAPVVAQPAPQISEPAKPVAVMAKKAEAPAPTPKPVSAAYAVAPTVSIPLKQAVSPSGKPYRGELGVSWQFYADAQFSCVKRARKGPERLYLPNGGGYVDVLSSRIVLRSCS